MYTAKSAIAPSVTRSIRPRGADPCHPSACSAHRAVEFQALDSFYPGSDCSLGTRLRLHIGVLYNQKMVSSIIKRGSAELAVLSVLAHGPLHGYEIAQRIERQTRGALHFTLASLYPLLYRLELRGWLRASWGETPAGRARRYYRITPVGRKKLAPLRREWEELFRALGRLAEAHRV